MPTHGEALLANGWTAGSVVPPELYDAIRPHLRHGEDAPLEISPTDWVAVVSQACDLVAKADNAEPYVELLVAHEAGVERPRTPYAGLRSTRYIDFRPNAATHPQLVLTAHATKDRFFVPRRLISGTHPDGARALSDLATEKLQRWIALRASRPAWPDALANRLRPMKDDLAGALEPLREEIAEVRVGFVPTGEIGDGENYTLAAHFVVEAARYEDQEERTRVQECFNQFIALVARCHGIEVSPESRVVSGNDFSWTEMNYTDIWNFEHLSNE